MATLYQSWKRPDEFSTIIQEGASEFARDYSLLADLVSKAGDQSEIFTLFLSTCRNSPLALNAMFVDLQEAFGRISPVAGLFGALQEARSHRFEAFEKHLSFALQALSAFEDKQTCWNKREELEFQLGHFLGEFSYLDKRRLQTILSDVVRSDELAELSEFSSLFKIDITEDSRFQSLFEHVRHTHRRLDEFARACADFMRLYTLAETEVKRNQTELFKEERDATFVEACSTMYRRTTTEFQVAPECRLLGEALTLMKKGALELSSSTPTINILEQANPREVAQLCEHIFSFFQQALLNEYSRFGERFRPNLIKTRLPRPFVIDLVPELASPPVALSGSTALTTKNFSFEPPRKVRVGIAQPPIAVAKCFSAKLCRYNDDTFRKKMKTWAESAILRSAEIGINVLVFPEMFFPEASCEAIRNLALRRGLTLVSGIEGIWTNGKYSSQASITFPGSYQEFRQYKNYPSNLEPENFESRGGQQCFINSPAGSFSVLLCSDFREFDVVAAIEQAPFLDYFIVCSCNPYSDLWNTIAIADAARFNCYVLISNWHGANGGAFCAGPVRSEVSNGVIEGANEPVHGEGLGNSEIGSVQYYDLDLGELWRDRHKPAPGLLSPPHRRLRINRHE